MIADSLKNAHLYYGLSEGIKTGLEFLQNNDFSKLVPGKYEIAGSTVFALVQSYESKPIENGKWEAHKKYIDIQYVFSGIEKMGYAVVNKLKVTQEYNEAQDCHLFEGEGSFITASANSFLIFYPDDAHMPCIAKDTPIQVKKVVVKVPV